MTSQSLLRKLGASCNLDVTGRLGEFPVYFAKASSVIDLNEYKTALFIFASNLLYFVSLATSLPKDDGEFYQFCYVTNAGQVRGASTPFQFKQPSAKEYIAVEDEDNDIMVIKTRTTALEEDLRKAAFENENLEKVGMQYLHIFTMGLCTVP